MRRFGVGLIASAALAAGACSDSTAPDEARYPVVEGLYDVDTRLVSNTCRFGAVDGTRVYVFFQEPGGIVEFRPPSFEGGDVVLLDFGIRGQLQPSGDFEMQGTYTIEGTGSSADLIVAFSMAGQFGSDNSLEAVEQHLASFPGGSCEVTFSLSGVEI